MYLESDRPLPIGTTIVIRTRDCDTSDNRDDSSIAGGPAPYFCKGRQLTSEVCRELKTLVVAKVNRCEDCGDLNSERYGIGVNYISPDV